MKEHWKIAASLGALALWAVAVGHARAATEKVLHRFPPGSYPYGRPQQDSAGNLYGTTDFTRDKGIIYQLKPDKTFTVLHTFQGADGANPVAGLTEDHASTIFYGVTRYGGVNNAGVVFSLTPSGTDWSYTVLHSFDETVDGSQPEALLRRDSATGNLYGTAAAGGARGCGTAFVLSQSGQTWNFQKLYDFQGGNDGCGSIVQLQPGPKAGTFIGATTSGGSHNAGTLFELSQSGGSWSEALLYTFTGRNDGKEPFDIDTARDGTIYGVTDLGGAQGAGTVFQLTPHRSEWSYSLTYTFLGASDGAFPQGIRLDHHTGVLYGTTMNGGSAGGGTVFELVKDGGVWSKTILHNFAGRPDGFDAASRPMLDKVTGILYGTTLGGGRNGGVVYRIAP